MYNERSYVLMISLDIVAMCKVLSVGKTIFLWEGGEVWEVRASKGIYSWSIVGKVNSVVHQIVQ